jgi:hypothetical protein
VEPETFYRERRPSAAALRSFVECLWTVRTDARGVVAPVERLLPDGCIELIVHLDEPYTEVTPDRPLRPQPDAFVVGEMTAALLVRPVGRTRTLGVRFRPGGAYPFLGPGLDALTDRAASLEDLWGAEGARLTSRLHDAPDDDAAMAAAEAFLLRRLASCRGLDRRVPAVVRAILASGGTARVSALSATAGVGPRQLERLLRATVGLGPKALSRVIRFQSLLRALAARPGAGRPSPSTAATPTRRTWRGRSVSSRA